MATRKAGSAGEEGNGEEKRPATKKRTSAKAESAATPETGANTTAETGAGKGGRGAAKKTTTRAAAGGGAAATADTGAAAQGGATKKRATGAKSAKTSAAGSSATGDAGAAGGSAGGAAGGAAKKRAAAGGSGKSSKGPDMRSDLRQFVEQHPHGWGHHEWEGLLGQLRERGHNVDDTGNVGASLERERLAMRLESIQGVGPQKVKSIADRFGSVWNLRHASVEEIADSAKLSRDVAERIRSEVQ